MAHKVRECIEQPRYTKKIEYLCGGDIQKFIDNPSCLRDLTGTNQDVMWMRTVTQEEAKTAYERVMKWAENRASRIPVQVIWENGYLPNLILR